MFVILLRSVSCVFTIKIRLDWERKKFTPHFLAHGDSGPSNFFRLTGLLGPYLNSKTDVPAVKIGVRGGANHLKKFLEVNFRAGRTGVLAHPTLKSFSAFCRERRDLGCTITEL